MRRFLLFACILLMLAAAAFALGPPAIGSHTTNSILAATARTESPPAQMFSTFVLANMSNDLTASTNTSDGMVNFAFRPALAPRPHFGGACQARAISLSSVLGDNDAIGNTGPRSGRGHAHVYGAAAMTSGRTYFTRAPANRRINLRC